MVESTYHYTNTRWKLTTHPTGTFHAASHSELDASIPMKVDASMAAAKVVVQVDMLSVDAFLRTMLDAKSNDVHGRIKLGDTLPALGYGRIVWAGPEALSGTGGALTVGMMVQGFMGAQTFASVEGKDVFPMLRVPRIPDSASLGLLGVTTGMTAYVGVHHVTTPPQKGEVVVVSAAAGAVGSVACQLARLQGARVVGIAGGAKKCRYVREVLGCHEAIDYKSTSKSVAEQLDMACPDGVDFFFDNVGGDILDLILCRLNKHARVVICGAISQYSGNLGKDKVQGPSAYLKLAERVASMHGFVVTQYLDSMWKMMKVLAALSWGYLRGQLALQEQVDVGIEAFPGALEKLFTGGHVGKMLVDVSATSSS